jgi:hypothetical protein
MSVANRDLIAVLQWKASDSKDPTLGSLELRLYLLEFTRINEFMQNIVIEEGITKPNIAKIFSFNKPVVVYSTQNSVKRVEIE